MKKLVLGLCLVMGIVLLTGCSEPKLSEDFNEEEVKTKAKEVIGLVNDQNTDALIAMSTEKMKEDLTKDVLKEFYEALEENGKFKEIEPIVVGAGEEKGSDIEYAVAIAKAEYEEKTSTYTISFNKDMKLAGLHFK